MSRTAPDDLRGPATFGRRLHNARQDLLKAQGRRRVAFASLDIPAAAAADAEVRRMQLRVAHLRLDLHAAQIRSARP